MISENSIKSLISLNKKLMNDMETRKEQYILENDETMAFYCSGAINTYKSVIEDLESIINN